MEDKDKICAPVFSYKKDLVMHKQSVHMGLMILCTDCEFETNWKNSLLTYKKYTSAFCTFWTKISNKHQKAIRMGAPEGSPKYPFNICTWAVNTIVQCVNISIIPNVPLIFTYGQRMKGNKM